MPYTGLYGFAGNQVEVRGHMELRTTFTDGVNSHTENVRYLIVNASSAYNILLGRPTLKRLRTVPSSRHMKMKLPNLNGRVITIRSNQKEAKRCYENNLKTKRGVFMVTTRAPHAEEITRPEMPSWEGQAWKEVAPATTREPSEERVSRSEIAQERRPEPTGDLGDREIGGKGLHAW